MSRSTSVRRSQKTRKTSSSSLRSIMRIKARALSSLSMEMNSCWMLSTVLTPLAVAISAGSRVWSRARRRRVSGKVAENSRVCRSSGVKRRIFFTSSMKPISSISSASSRTTNSVQGKDRNFCS